MARPTSLLLALLLVVVTLPAGAAVIVLEVEAPGASPAEVEALVVIPLEHRVGQLKEIERIRALAGVGRAELLLQVAKPDRTLAALGRQLEAMAAELPEWAGRPAVRIVAPEPVVSYALTAEDGDPTPLLAARIAPALERIAGVSRLDVVGATTRTLEIRPDLDRLAQHGLTVEALASALSAEWKAPDRLELDPERFETADAAGAVVVRTGPDGAPVRVRDVATIAEIAQAESSAVLDGRPVVVIRVVPMPGASPEDLRQQVATSLVEVFADEELEGVGYQLVDYPAALRLLVAETDDDAGRRYLEPLGRFLSDAKTPFLLTATDDRSSGDHQLTIALAAGQDRADIRAFCATLPGVTTLPAEPAIVLRLFGPSRLAAAQAVSERLGGLEGATLAPAPSARTRPELEVNLQAGRAARLGVTLEQVRAALRGESDPRAVQELLLRTPNGQLVPLSEVAEVSVTLGPRQIERLDGERCSTVWVWGVTVEALEQAISSTELPADARWQIEGR